MTFEQKRYATIEMIKAADERPINFIYGILIRILDEETVSPILERATQEGMKTWSRKISARQILTRYMTRLQRQQLRKKNHKKQFRHMRKQ